MTTLLCTSLCVVELPVDMQACWGAAPADNCLPLCVLFHELLNRLYLNNKGADFEGGDFAFLDDGTFDGACT